jgi:UDP-N-acetylmuramoyl-L-alanyl-D-glutamate--2,6-diaminopimelate ligase
VQAVKELVRSGRYSVLRPAQPTCIVLTSDNPRREDPRSILAEVAVGVGAHPDLVIESNRALAIRLALARATLADLVLIAGKGQEQTQDQGGITTAFSDVQKCSVVALARHRVE